MASKKKTVGELDVAELKWVVLAYSAGGVGLFEALCLFGRLLDRWWQTW